MGSSRTTKVRKTHRIEIPREDLLKVLVKAGYPIVVAEPKMNIGGLGMFAPRDPNEPLKIEWTTTEEEDWDE